MLPNRRMLLRASIALGVATAAGPVTLLAQAKPRVIPIRALKFTYEPAELTLKLN